MYGNNETDVVRNGKNKRGVAKYYCRKADCKSYFQLDYAYNGCKPGINEQIVKMAANASGIRDTSRVINITTDKVMSTLKKQKPQSQTSIISTSIP